MKIPVRLYSGAVTALFISMYGCTFNVKEDIKEVTLTHTSAGLTKVVMQSTLLDDNTISAQGVDEKSVTIMALARMLVIKDEPESLDGLQLTISSNGTISYISPEAYQNRVTFDDLTMDIDRRLACDFESISGNIKIEGMEGLVTCESISGNCTVASKKGCSIKTVSGDISLTVLSDSLIDSTQWTMKSVSGEIKIYLPDDTSALANKQCTITIKSTSGDVVITVPKGFSADLLYKTSSGDKRQTSYFSDVNTSSVTITCTTTSGDLRIRSYN